MAEEEMQAHDFVRRRSWSRAVALYDQILAQILTQSSNPNRSYKDRQITCLLGRCECLLELGKYESCLSDARKVLALLSEQTDCLASISRARRWLIHALCKLKLYTEAEQILFDWIAEFNSQQNFSDISKTLERYKSIIQMINGHKSAHKITNSRLEDEMAVLDTKIDHWATNNLPLDKYSKLLSNKGLKKREGITLNGSASSSSSISSSGSGTSMTTMVQKSTDLLSALRIKHHEDSDNATTCSYCAISFQSRNELRQHCQTESHQNVIMSYEGRDWKWRPPPRGFTLDSYSICEAFTESQTCHYGNQCVEAHGLDELNEWKERFEYRRMRLQKACEKELYGKSYTEQILDRWIQATAPERVMSEKVEGIEASCENDLVTSISSKTSKRTWTFLLKTSKNLRAVALLQDAHRNHFAIKSIRVGASQPSTAHEVELKSNQEWVLTKSNEKEDGMLQCKPTFAENCEIETVIKSAELEHQVTIEFHTDIYGTFRQAICFDFGSEPLLVKQLCVDVVPVGEVEKIEEIKRDIINSSATRWDISNTNLVKFETTIGTHLKTEAYLRDLKHEKEMLERYPCPRAETFTLTQSTIVEKRLTQNNYRSRIHELLYVEEIARYEQIARYNVRTKLTVISKYILTPAGTATSTTKYSISGEFFALMRLGKDISEDTSAGRLILFNCSSVYISQPDDHLITKEKERKVFEAIVEDKGKNVIYLKLSAKCVEDMALKVDTDIEVDIQFQLNRLPYCEWHNAVDKITDFKIIFPATETEPSIPWTPKKQWSDTCEPKLNAKQREAVNAITTSLDIKLPPILLIGPFGTGKTYTLAQAIKQLLTQPEAKILICTHSNSAADLYIKEYLHPWIENGIEEATPLRVYYHKRWVTTVNSVVQKYCITDGAGYFRRPTVEDIMKHRIVVVTLSISMELATLGLPKGYFTHIFLDEAAQAMECEAIMPLALANDSTRIVLAGDHMQMSPELFSAFAKERKLHISLLERLYDHYPSSFPCKILLCENYRAHEAIIKFTSELFYEQKLIASGKQPRHERFYPLTFFTTRGEDIQDKNSTAFYNNAEVYEVVERVSELRKKWPTSWGKINDASIGIMTPYADQVFRIRSELRKRRMGGISVERVLNVQGKQFRAVFLSTVRTRRTCIPQVMNGAQPGNSLGPPEDTDYGFLSNSKLLNTAITRAQSLVAVIGDPVALCSIGRCRKVWERFIEICDENKSLFGITWSYLRSQLDGVELKRGYVLNPLAPEFIPRSMQPEAYLRDQTAMFLMGANLANSHHGPPHMGALHNAGHMVPHANMLAAAAAGQMPNHHGMGNQPMPHMYPQYPAAAAYNAAAGPESIMNQNMNKGMHHFPNHPNHMGIRGIGPQQPPPPQLSQQYNPRGPPPSVHLNQQQPPTAAGQIPQYMWQQAQQQLRGGPPTAGGGYPPGALQQGSLQNQNPNASLWGPPPQSNPWSVLPKQPLQQPPNAAGNNRQLPPPPQQQVPGGIRGGSVPLQPPPNQAMRTNPNDLGYLQRKPLYGQQHPPPPNQQPPQHNNFQNYSGGNAANGQMRILGILSPMKQGMQRSTTNKFYNVVYPGVSTPIANSNFQKPQQIPNNKQQSPTSLHFPQPPEHLALLPPNVTIYEMAFEPKESQYRWYLKLLETHGQEAANKFTELLRQVMAMLHQHQQQQDTTKPLPQLQQQQQQTNLNTNQIMQRELMQQGLPPPMGAAANSLNHQPPQLQQNEQHRISNNGIGMQHFMNAGMNPGSSLIKAAASDTPPLDTGVNFNQQIDLVFNSLMTGNEISPPILRDLFGMVSGPPNNGMNNNMSGPVINNINNDLLLTGAQTGSAPQSKVFPLINNINDANSLAVQQTQQSPLNIPKPQQQQMFPMHQAGHNLQQPQQTQQINTNNFLGNNAASHNYGASTSSVPLYLRQALTAGNGNNTIPGNSVHNYHNSNASMQTGGNGVNNNLNTQTLHNSTHEGLLTGGTNDILAGLETGACNLIEALFQANAANSEHQNNNTAFHKLLYNNYTASLKPNELDIFMREHNFGLAGINNTNMDNTAVTGTNHHQPHIPHTNSGANAPDGRNTTYAAVLSQGPQQPAIGGAGVGNNPHAMHHNFQNELGNTTNNMNSNIANSGGNGVIEIEKDPFAAIRELGQGSNGFYNYFQ
ncbi:probable helicase with zinc finger domain [Teleopsis dalmanni]|uniref:probable helicase with zinc finger domain n=1 Tax=Teleopsis dalmanni TaxID=139649 RepID=UPI0018CD015F|nr:probable helicase with zinc finger domain [Teleopsis dalmanni]